MFNTNLAVEVLARIEDDIAHREQWQEAFGQPHWNQGVWGQATLAVLQSIPDAIEDEAGNVIGTGTCGTAQCFAGHALSARRVRLVWAPSYHDRTVADFHADTTADGTPVSRAACELLGIEPPGDFEWDQDPEEIPENPEDPTWDYANGYPGLFSGTNTIDDLYRIVAEYAEMSVPALRERVTQFQEARDRVSPAEFATGR